MVDLKWKKNFARLFIFFTLITFCIFQTPPLCFSYNSLQESFCITYRLVRKGSIPQKLLDIEDLMVQVQETPDKSKKERLVNEIKSLIYQLHGSISTKTKKKYTTLKKAIAKKEASIKDVFDFFYDITALAALRKKEGTEAWKLHDGSFMDADAHNKEVIKGLQMLKKGNYEYFNQRRDGKEKLSEKNFSKVVDIYKELLSNPADRETIWITASLHDYGKLLLGDHYTDGVKLVSDLLKELDVSKEKVNFISNLIFTHADPGMISIGEVPPQKLINYMEENNIQDKDKFLKMLMVLNVVDVNAVGEGKFSNQYLTERLYFSNLDNLEKLSEVFNEVRLSGLRGGPLIELGPTGDIDVKKIKSGLSQKIKQGFNEKITDREKKEFFNDFMRDMSFDYATFLIRNMEAENVVKWLYLNAKVAELSRSNIEMIRNTSDRVAGELDEALNHITISDIRSKFKNSPGLTESLKKGKTIELFNIPMWLEDDGRLLIIDTNSLWENNSKEAFVIQEKFGQILS